MQGTVRHLAQIENAGGGEGRGKRSNMKAWTILGDLRF